MNARPTLPTSFQHRFRHRLRQSATAAIAAAALLTGCTVNAALDRADWLAQTETRDRGDFRIRYGPIQGDRSLQPLKHVLETSGTYEAAVADLNAALRLPEDVTIEFSECGSEDAYYDPNLRQITLCYELIQRYTQALGSRDGTLETAALHAGLFTLFHELGHTLIDLLELPFTGREEDTADEFATVMLLWSGHEEAALSGAKQFSMDADEWEAVPYWDEHGTDMQRFYNIACYVYGSDTQAWAHLVGDDWLPAQRADLCEEDYGRKSRSWDQLLGPHLKRQIELTALNEQLQRNSMRGF